MKHAVRDHASIEIEGQPLPDCHVVRQHICLGAGVSLIERLVSCGRKKLVSLNVVISMGNILPSLRGELTRGPMQKAEARRKVKVLAFDDQLRCCA
jgi:hypothetical protein